MIPGIILKPLERHSDERGFFTEVVRASQWPVEYIQSNHSHSKRGALRGLHYHRRQADLWYVARGRAQVGLADLRDTTMEPVTDTVILDGDEPHTLLIPPGVAHGYLALSDVDLFYWVTQEYDASDEFGIAWNDPTLQIPWEMSEPLLSERDRKNPLLREL